MYWFQKRMLTSGARQSMSAKSNQRENRKPGKYVLRLIRLRVYDAIQIFFNRFIIVDGTRQQLQ